MKILGVITARGNSRRVRNKNTLKLEGKPLIAYTINAAKQSRLINRIVCSSDSGAILNLVKSYSVETIKRPEKLALDNSPIEEALRHAIRYLREREGYFPDLVVLLYANIPYRKKGLLDSAIRKLNSSGADALVSVSFTERYHPERLVVLGSKDRFVPYVKKFSTFRRQELSRVYFIDSGVIVFKTRLLFGRDPLIISHYFKGRNVIAFSSEDLAAWDIDNHFDLDVARLILRRKKKGDMVI